MFFAMEMSDPMRPVAIFLLVCYFCWSVRLDLIPHMKYTLHIAFFFCHEEKIDDVIKLQYASVALSLHLAIFYASRMQLIITCSRCGLSMPLINNLGARGLSFLNENVLSMCIGGWMWHVYAWVRKGELNEKMK